MKLPVPSTAPDCPVMKVMTLKIWTTLAEVPVFVLEPYEVPLVLLPTKYDGPVAVPNTCAYMLMR